MSDVDLMKCMDLTAKLGLVLETNPVWKGGYVIFDNDPVVMLLVIDTGRWQIATGDFGVLNLPKEALELMTEMSKIMGGCDEDPLENGRVAVEVATELFRGSNDADIIARAKTAAVFGKLLDMGLAPEDLKTAIEEVNNAD